ncbi:3-hydroxyacyl-[acyl-carrier-protein] dehydratase [Croceifilum oryzae]|uniref:3-hydroxyacyl-[acyl-carrier-protein] dehydratase n=1 Tax=Croceifilum oryzae TaxID=1553429 RepID=A0AAJ1TPI3_9BACL|nr:3-hydroxyacyl-ACP dehydratase FabZ [Croceifilum oryzae]MDQ0418545.1 3-hydroxyacyl-[acyl-carrier-protein] dehydratase [Croceifilum oryzae]
MTVMNADEIRKLLPHRWPFLLLDRVIELKPGVSGVGIKNVTISEPFFEGHFPNESIMPGVLIVEALAQMTAVVYCTGALQTMREAEQEAAATAEAQAVESTEEVDISSRVGYLVAIRDMKFMKPVAPGDQLLLKVKIGRSLGILSKVNVAAYVGKECVVEGTLSVSQRP